MPGSTAYQAALHRAAYYFQPNAGYLRLSGADRVDFLQRQSTNDVRQQATDRSVETVLTSPTARLLDVFCLMDEGETLGVITLPGRQAETAQFLRSRIFFSDQVSVADLSSDYAQVLVVGPQADGLLGASGIQPPTLNGVVSGPIAGCPVTIIGREILLGIDYTLIFPKDSLPSVLAALSQAGAQPLDADIFNILRVEAGQPGPLGEFVADYTPLELGCQKMISASKGCYTGQEVIARQITYDKVTRQLSGVKLERAAEVGQPLFADQKPVGSLTSVVDSPRFGWIGLSVVRRPFHEPGTHLSVLDAAEAPLDAEVVGLPFS